LQDNIQVTAEDFHQNLIPTKISFFDIKESRRITTFGCGLEYIVAVENMRNIYSWGKNKDG